MIECDMESKNILNVCVKQTPTKHTKVANGATGAVSEPLKVAVAP